MSDDIFYEKPDVGEYFLDGSNGICHMRTISTYDRLTTPKCRNLFYIENSKLFSKQAELDPNSAKGALYMREKEELKTGFVYALPEGHNTKTGLQALEAAYIEYVYKRAKYNQSRAAKMLGISRGCIRMKLKEYFGDQYL